MTNIVEVKYWQTSYKYDIDLERIAAHKGNIGGILK